MPPSFAMIIERIRAYYFFSCKISAPVVLNLKLAILNVIPNHSKNVCFNQKYYLCEWFFICLVTTLKEDVRVMFFYWERKLM